MIAWIEKKIKTGYAVPEGQIKISFEIKRTKCYAAPDYNGMFCPLLHIR